MGHVVLIEDRRAIGYGTGELVDNLAPVRLTIGNHFISARVVDAGCLEIVRIKRFVPNRRVIPIFPGAHQRDRDIAWPITF